MEKTNLENLNRLAKLFGTDRLISPEDIQEIRSILIGVLANNKQELEILTEDTRNAVESVLNKITAEHDTYLEKTKQMAQEVKSDVTEAIKKATKDFEEVKKLAKEVMECKPEDGEDADEEMIIQEVLAKIKLPEYKEVVLDDGTEIVSKINDLSVSEENQIDAKHIKNLPEFKNGRWSGITKGAVIKLIEESGAAGVTLKVDGTENIEQGTLDLIAGSGITIVDNGDGTVTFTATGGGGGSGDVVGPASAVNNKVVLFDGTTGKLIKDSGLSLAGNNTGDQTSIVGITGTKAQFDTAVTDGNFLYVGDVTQYTDEMAQDTVGGMVDSSLVYSDATPSLSRAALTGDVTASAGSNTTAIKNDVALGGSPTTTTQSAGDNTTKIATTAFVTTAVANGTVGLLDYRGSYDASTNLFPATGGSGLAGAILKGDFYICSVGGTLGGTAVTPGDLIIAIVDTPGQTSGNWDLIEHNLGAYVSDVTGTTNRITSSGGATPSIDISATFEALLGKVASPLSQFAASTSAAIGVGTVELGHASDTTLSRSSAGVLAVEGVVIPSISSTNTLTNKTLTTPTINGATITGDFQTDGLPDTDDTWTGKSTNSFNAAGTIAQFDCVYLTSSSTWALTDADAIGTAGNVLIMMAGAAGTNGNALRVIEPGSWVRNDAWNWTVGGVLYLDTATPGGMTQTVPSGTDDAVKIVGHAVSADVIYFNPSPNWIIRV